MSKFQTILIGVFIAFMLIGVIVFSFSKGSSKVAVPIVVWGTVPNDVFSAAFNRSAFSKDKTVSISYVQKDPTTFDNDFLNALAIGKGPDVVLLPQEEIFKNQSKLFTIPYTAYSQRDYLNTYIQEGSLFLGANGTLALPILVDPLVMYWNRDIFNSAAIPTPPSYWDQFYSLANSLTVKDGAFNITQSAVALGGYSNVTNAKDIISALLLQAGTPIVALQSNGALTSVLTQDFGLPVSPAVSVTTFYTEFSNPAKTDYSWNRSLPNSQDMFTAGNLAIYFGFASELNVLRQKNPNLNFDVQPLPQSRTSQKKITFGRMLAFAIVKNSPKISSAYTALVGLTSADSVASFSKILGIPPARLDLLAIAPKDAYSTVFYQSALQSMGWLDVDSVQTASIFQNLIENITSGKATEQEALVQADSQLRGVVGSSIQQ
jgi:multiple sugar transport system substrate-binding protein